MHVFNIFTILAVLMLVGVELSVSAFINPVAWRLAPEPQLVLLSRLAFVLGRVMPVWYQASTLILGVQTWLHWHTSGRALLLLADAIWLLVLATTILFLAPLNNRIAAGATGWQAIHRTWDMRHRVRICALFTAALVLTSALVR